MDQNQLTLSLVSSHTLGGCRARILGVNLGEALWALLSQLAKPVPASWLGTQASRLRSAVLAGAPLLGSLGTRTQA